MTRRKRLALMILIPLGLLALVVGVQGIRYWWYRGFSRGSRTGIIRKLSVKGSPLCKYLSGEMMLINAGNNSGQQDVWEFTVDDDRPTNPIVMRLHEAEKTARPVTVDYRQDLGNKGKFPFKIVCAPTEYYVVGVE